MKIELKSIKHYPSMSEETNCYEAALWVDGRKIGTVSNRGQGGCDDFHPVTHADYAIYEAAEKWITANLPPVVSDLVDEKGERFTYQPDMESVCGDLLDAFIIGREFDKAIRRKAVFTVPSKTGIFQTGYKGSTPPDARLFDHVAKQHPGAVVLNTMPRAAALALFKANV